MEIQIEKIEALLFKIKKVFGINELRKKTKCFIIMEKYLLIKLSSVENKISLDKKHNLSI